MFIDIHAHAIGGRMSQYYVDQLAPLIHKGGDFWLEVVEFHHVQELSYALKAIGAEHMLVGTDYNMIYGEPPYLPYGVLHGIPDPDVPGTHRAVRSAAENPFEPSVASFVAFLKQAGATAAEIEAIAWGNAAALYGLQS
jgi:microsomal dipeptidase-like Zn-dependent dipeptidase